MKIRNGWFLVVVTVGLMAQSPFEDRFRPLPEDFFANTIYAQPDYRLNLGGELFDPLEEMPGIGPAWLAVPDRQPSLHLLQFFRPIRRQDLALIQGRGFRVVQSLRPFTLIVWGRADALPGNGAWSNLRWSGAFQPGFKVLPQSRALSRSRQVQMLAYAGGEVSSRLADELKAMGGRGFTSRRLDDRFTIWVGELDGAAFVGAAHLAEVYSIQLQAVPRNRGELSAQLIANNLNVMNQAVTGYQNWLTQLGLNGAGVIMACVDAGVRETHPDLAGQFLNCVGPGCGGAVFSGHGTHVAGIMAATGVAGVVDPNGFLRAIGVAPGSKMVEQLYLNLALDPGGLLALMEESFANNAVLSNNSWGLSPMAQGYDIPAMELDIGVRDADPVAAGNQGFHYILAVENGNGGVSSIGSPDEAKNVFQVGAHQAQLANTNQVAEFNNLAGVSGHGPALDGRFLPLIVAPGCLVESAQPDTVYQLRCGTSMAAPHVAGGVGLFFEYYRNLTSNLLGTPVDPSPALVKAAFLPVAVNLEGFLDADGNPLGHRVDAKQGWGRLSLPPILQPDVPVLYYDNPRTLNNTGEVWRRLLQVSDNTKPMKLMLVWTDAPGHGLGGATPALNNDLDLEVVNGGQTFLGNIFDGSGWSAQGGIADALNNSEGVLLGPTANGSFEVTVKATDLNADAVPNLGSNIDQDFALVCYNCQELASFSIGVTPDNRSVCAPQNGVFTLNLAAIGGFASPVTFSLPNLPAGLMAQFSQNPATPTTTSILTLSNTNNVARGAYEITVLATAGSIQRQIILDLFVELGLPATGVALMPADMATDISLTPEFSWDVLPTAASYRFELALEPGFANPVLVLDQTETNLSMLATLLPTTTYFWRIAGNNQCGQGPFSPVRSFLTRTIPPILLVDDDDNSPDVRASYTQALDGLGLTYDVFDTQNSAQEPTNFADYQTVVWFSGATTDEVNPKAGPTVATQALLQTFLDQGGSFLVSSQSYLNDLNMVDGNFNPFMRNYLGVANGTRDVANSVVTGMGTVFNGIGPETITVAFTNNSDVLNPTVTAELAFAGDQGNAAVLKETAMYKTCYLGFALEGLNTSALELVFTRWFGYLGFELACQTQADFLVKLPSWAQTQSLMELVTCINAINAP